MTEGIKISWSNAELAFIKRHTHLPRREIHRRFTTKFDRPDIGIPQIKSLCENRGWRNGRGFTPYSQAELDFIKAHAELPCRELRRRFVEKFHRDVSVQNVSSARLRNGWLTGRVGWRIGNPPPPTIGTEKLSAHGYVLIYIGKQGETAGRRRDHYVPKHKWLWEKEHGPVANGHKLKCVDGNLTNTDPSNWNSVPNALLAGLARRKVKSLPTEFLPTMIAVAKLEHELLSSRTVRITKVQRAELLHLRDTIIPSSFKSHGWPGFPEQTCDRRALPALHKKGWVECGVHEWSSPSNKFGKSVGVWWRITDTGRTALKETESPLWTPSRR